MITYNETLLTWKGIGELSKCDLNDLLNQITAVSCPSRENQARGKIKRTPW